MFENRLQGEYLDKTGHEVTEASRKVHCEEIRKLKNNVFWDVTPCGGC
jgi:hypothetical protein